MARKEGITAWNERGVSLAREEEGKIFIAGFHCVLPECAATETEVYMKKMDVHYRKREKKKGD